MKKRIIACTLLFVFAMLSATAEYYPGLGMADAWYFGTTKNTTIEKVYDSVVETARLSIPRSNGRLSNPMPFSGKLSKRQSDLLWKALEQYDYAAGEIYSVLFQENGTFKNFFLAVQIEARGSCTWMGIFSYVLH